MRAANVRLPPPRASRFGRNGWPGTDAAAGRSDEQILETFREALRAFVGSRYFHNYTRRSYYSPSNEKAEWTKRGRKNRRRDELAAVDDDDHLETADDDDDVVGVVEDARRHGRTRRVRRRGLRGLAPERVTGC